MRLGNTVIFTCTHIRSLWLIWLFWNSLYRLHWFGLVAVHHLCIAMNHTLHFWVSDGNNQRINRMAQFQNEPDDFFYGKEKWMKKRDFSISFLQKYQNFFLGKGGVKPLIYILKLAFFVVTIYIFAAVSINRTLCVKLVIALLISWHTSVAPNLFTLPIQCGTFTIKTISLIRYIGKWHDKRWRQHHWHAHTIFVGRVKKKEKEKELVFILIGFGLRSFSMLTV